MKTLRLSASSYSNTAPLVWSFLYGKDRGSVELIMDTAPPRSAELLAHDRVDAALVPVIAYQMIDNIRLIPDVCVGASECVRSVCLVTKGAELKDVRTVSLDTSSRTSVALTKIIFREFLGFEPDWREADPDIEAMLSISDAALLIGDPALILSESATVPDPVFRVFDLVELWRSFTGFGFVFAMWMTRSNVVPIDFAAARDEGIAHAESIIANYRSQIPLNDDAMFRYLTENISYTTDDSMKAGMKLYFELAAKNRLIAVNKPLIYTE